MNPKEGQDLSTAEKSKRPQLPYFLRKGTYPKPTIRTVPNVKSLQSTIDQCVGGDEVVLPTGMYTECITISVQDLVIRAEKGAFCSISVDNARSPAILFAASGTPRIENITIIQENRNCEAIVIERGFPEIVGCTINGAKAGILVRQNHVYTKQYPVIQKCIISNGRGVGVHLFQSHAIIEDCELSSNLDVAILCEGARCNPWICGNKIRNGRAGGVFFGEHSTGVLTNNEIRGNRGPGVKIESQAHPILFANTIEENTLHGVSLDEDGQGIIEGNSMSRNGEAEVYVSRHSAPAVRDNKLLGGQANGIVVTERAAASIDGNTLSGYADSAIEIRSGSTATILNNVVFLESSTSVAMRLVGARATIQRTIVVTETVGDLDRFFDTRGMATSVTETMIMTNKEYEDYQTAIALAAANVPLNKSVEIEDPIPSSDNNNNTNPPNSPIASDITHVSEYTSTVNFTTPNPSTSEPTVSNNNTRRQTITRSVSKSQEQITKDQPTPATTTTSNLRRASTLKKRDSINVVVVEPKVSKLPAVVTPGTSAPLSNRHKNEDQNDKWSSRRFSAPTTTVPTKTNKVSSTENKSVDELTITEIKTELEIRRRKLSPGGLRAELTFLRTYMDDQS